MNSNLNPAIAQALRPWAFPNYKRTARNDTVDITFHGLELTVELDYMGNVDSIMAASDGTDVLHDFNAATVEEIGLAAKASQMESA